jgi:hypothetical protein
MSDFGIPGTGAGGRPLQHIPGQGAFAIPTGVQRIAEQGLWSSFRYAAALAITGTVSTLFTVQLGATGNNFAGALSLSETNQQVAGQAPGDETYEISAISAEIYGLNAVPPLINDVRLFQRLGIFRWQFGQTIIDVSPLSMVGSGGGIFGFTADAGTPVTAANNGNGQLWMYSGVVIAIPSTQRFSMLIVYGTAGLVAPALAPVAETQIRCTLFNMARTAVPIA